MGWIHKILQIEGYDENGEYDGLTKEARESYRDFLRNGSSRRDIEPEEWQDFEEGWRPEGWR